MGRYDALIQEIGLSKSMPDDMDDDSALDAPRPDDEGADLEAGVDDDRDLEAMLGALRKVTNVVVAQGRAIAAMRDELDAIKGHVGPPMHKAMPEPGSDQLAAAEFMAKALDAQAAGRLSGNQVAIAEAHINAGKQPPADIVSAVLSERG